jgi:hypothetical protein
VLESIKLKYGSGTSHFGHEFKEMLPSSDSCSAGYHHCYLVEERWAGWPHEGEDIIRVVPISTID